MTEKLDLDKRINDLTARVHETEAKFSRHLDAIADERHEMKLQMEAILEIITPMAETFKGSKFTIDLVISFLKFLGILGAGLAAMLYLLSKIKSI